MYFRNAVRRIFGLQIEKGYVGKLKDLPWKVNIESNLYIRQSIMLSIDPDLALTKKQAVFAEWLAKNCIRTRDPIQFEQI